MPCRPSCSICVSDCDANAHLTSCQHFLCARCVQKYPKGTCPRCQKPCKTVPFNSNSFPKDFAERMQVDVKRHLNVSLQAMELQQRLEAAASQRLKEIVTTLNNQNRQLAQQVQATQTALRSKEEELASLQAKCQQLQATVTAQQQQQMSFHNSHHQPNNNPPFSAPSSDFTGGSGWRLGSLPNAGSNSHPPPQSSQLANNAVAPWSPAVSSHGFATPQPAPLGWGRTDSMKRPRDSQTQQQAVAVNGGLASLMYRPPTTMGPQPTTEVAFQLATPALTIREGGMTQQQRERPPLPKLQSLLPPNQGLARIVHSSSGHG